MMMMIIIIIIIIIIITLGDRQTNSQSAACPFT
jgi:hypothetical protein